MRIYFFHILTGQNLTWFYTLFSRSNFGIYLVIEKRRNLIENVKEKESILLQNIQEIQKFVMAVNQYYQSKCDVILQIFECVIKLENGVMKRSFVQLSQRKVKDNVN